MRKFTKDDKIAGAIGCIVIIAYIIIFIMIACAGPVEAFELNTIKAVIHHSDSGDKSAETIDKEHKERHWKTRSGEIRHWSGIGYNYVITADGFVESGRSLNKKGSHARRTKWVKIDRNKWLGIVLTGRNKFTKKQKDSLKILLKAYKVTHIENHHGNCPGKGLNLTKMAKELNITYKKRN